VSEAECRKRVVQLKALLAQLSFRNVKTDADACRTPSREGAVTVEPGPEDLALRVGSVHGDALRGGEQLVSVTAELRHAGERTFRIVWQPSGEQPLLLIVDGKEHPLPIGPSTAALLGWIQFYPDQRRSETTSLTLPVGPHTLAWRYRVDAGPYGRPLENCWKGVVTSPTVTIQAGTPGELRVAR
jgi:hypothetical protein